DRSGNPGAMEAAGIGNVGQAIRLVPASHRAAQYQCVPGDTADLKFLWGNPGNGIVQPAHAPNVGHNDILAVGVAVSNRGHQNLAVRAFALDDLATRCRIIPSGLVGADQTERVVVYLADTEGFVVDRGEIIEIP